MEQKFSKLLYFLFNCIRGELLCICVCVCVCARAYVHVYVRDEREREKEREQTQKEEIFFYYFWLNKMIIIPLAFIVFVNTITISSPTPKCY